MAKTSSIAKNEKRKKLVAQYATRRLELKKIINNPNAAAKVFPFSSSIT
jgi:small subunit ribosomal protein S14